MTDVTDILNQAMAADSSKLSDSVNEFLKDKVADIFVAKRDELEQDMLGSDTEDDEYDDDEYDDDEGTED